MKKEKSEKRFIRVHSERMQANEIWVDKETGVNYFYHQSGYSGGLTPLLDKDGKVIVTPMPKEEQGR